MERIYYWIKPKTYGYDHDKSYTLAYADGQTYFRTVEGGTLYSDKQILDSIKIERPVLKLPEKITEAEVASIIGYLRKHGAINNGMHSRNPGVGYVTGKWLKGFAAEYGRDVSTIKDMDIYDVGDGNFTNKIKRVNVGEVKAHICQYCNESMMEHNKNNDTPYNCLSAWGCE